MPRMTMEEMRKQKRHYGVTVRTIARELTKYLPEYTYVQNVKLVRLVFSILRDLLKENNLVSIVNFGKFKKIVRDKKFWDNIFNQSKIIQSHVRIKFEGHNSMLNELMEYERAKRKGKI